MPYKRKGLKRNKKSKRTVNRKRSLEVKNIIESLIIRNYIKKLPYELESLIVKYIPKDDD